MYEEKILIDQIMQTKPLIKTSIFEIIYENINLYNIKFIHQTYDSYSYLPIE